MLRGEQVHRDLPMEAQGTMVPEGNEALHPAAIRIPSNWNTLKDLAESGMFPSTPTGVKINRLDAFRKGRPEVGELSKFYSRAGCRTPKSAMAWDSDTTGTSTGLIT